MSEITTQVVREAPELEARRLGLYESARGLAQSGIPIPTQQMAAMSGLQSQAADLAEAGIGSYQPYLQQAGYSLGDAGQGIQQSVAGLGGTTQMYDPRTAQRFMNPYEDTAVQQALSDIQRQGDIQAAQQGSQAVAAGAFGGARQGIQEAELTRNILDQQARTASQMRQVGFENAANRAQSAFESAKGRGQNAVQLGIAGGQAMGGLGLQQASLGELGQQLGQRDIQSAYGMGSALQQQQQLGLDALYNAQQAQYQQPYQQLGFVSDILSRVPTSQQTITQTSGGQPSGLTTALGLGIGGLSAVAGAKRAGLFPN